MTTYNTNNPVGSTAVKDIYDNAENLDKALNDTAAATWTDRLGRTRRTYVEIERLADPGTALDAAARAEEAADRAAAYDNLLVYISYNSPSDKRMVDDMSQPVGTLGRVTNDADPGRNGDYVKITGGWEKSKVQPADSKAVADLQRETRVLQRDTSNIYPDASILDVSLYSGDVGGLATTTAPVPNRNLVQTISTTAEASIISPSFPVEAGAAYFVGGRIGNQESSGSTGELYVDWYSNADGGGPLISSTLIGTRTSNAYVNRFANVIAPETARSAKLRAVKSASTLATRGGFSFPVVRRAIDDPRMLRPDFLPAYTLAPQRFVDSPFYLTDVISTGVPAGRPVFTGFTAYTGTSGTLAQMSALSGVVARRETFSTWAASNDDPYTYDVKFVYGNRSTSVGSIPALELGIAWYDGNRAFLSETILASQPNIPGGMRAFKTTVGTPGSAAEYPSPSNARYFSPFIRWAQTAQILLISDITVSLAASSDGPGDIDLAEVDRQLESKASLTEVWNVSPLRLSEAEAASLTRYQRFMHEWYLIDGQLVHRDDLPGFEVQPIALSQSFPGGDYDPSGTSESGDLDTITIRGRKTGGQVGHFAMKVSGCLGKAPVITITHADEWNSPGSTVFWHLCWGTDLDSDVWTPFDSVTYSSELNSWTASNTKAFDTDTIYITRMPLFSYGRYDKKIRHWISSGLTRPTPSAVDGYRLGTIPGRTGTNGKSAPDADCFAFTIGTGPKKFILTSGMHPDEMPGHYTFEGAIDALLSAELAPLREAFTFYVYPRLNAQGLYAGVRRYDIQANQDLNRIWGDGETTSDITALYLPALNGDVGAEVAGFLDFHSTPGTNPTSGNGSHRAFWYNSADPAATASAAFVTALQSRGALRLQESSDGHTITNYFRSMGVAKLIGAVEHLHGSARGVRDWRQYGVDVMQSLNDIKALF
jgi:hypothetical protein